MARRAPRRRVAGLMAGAVAAAVMLSSQDAFLQAKGSSSATRRDVVLGGVVPVLLGAAQEASAIPRVTDRNVYINRRKVELIPIMKQGIDYLKKAGVDERMLSFTPKLVRKMELYAYIFSATEAPDATVRTLQKDCTAFKAAIEEKKDKELALQLFEQYRLHIPKGVGYFDLDKPGTYEAPPP
mmetsp:Transcript_21025/g.55673  ORF Transcript_21025/g.55673 Transcript_21025/m.55673 type:complete len:183 (+) Transcript_21025:122-670(+)